MTEQTNHCADHSGVAGCTAGMKKQIDGILGSMVPRWVFVLIGSVVIVFGLILIQGNSSAIGKNTVKIECLQDMADDIRAIKAVVVKE